jgi:hypothetical protein
MVDQTVLDSIRTLVEQDAGNVRPTIRAWLETAKNHALFANDGGIYDELLEYLRSRRIFE